MMARQIKQYKLQEVSREIVFLFKSLEKIHPIMGMMSSQKGPPAFDPLIVITRPRGVTIADELLIFNLS